MVEYDTLECPCCGDDAAEEGTLVHDGQPLLCGCAGHMSVCSEAGVWPWLSDEECPPGALCREE